MHPTAEGWQIMLKLPAGIYEYKFIVDGHWMTDPANPNKVPNNYKTWNSILLVGKKVEFVLPGYEDAKKVVLSGSFNNWDRQAITFTRYLNSWTCSVDLPPGKHFYKIIIDGQWTLDPTNDLTQIDGKGNLNSVVLVR